MTYDPVLAHTNATLTKVAAAGSTDSYEGAPAAGAQKWAGSEQVWVADDEQVQEAAGERNVLSITRMRVDARLGVAFELGDLVTYSFAGAVHTREVNDKLEYTVSGVYELRFWNA